MRAFSFLVLLSLFVSFQGFDFQKSYAEDICKLHLQKQLKHKIRYPAGRVEGDEDILKFGFESEYTFDRLDGILTHYAPEEQYIARAAWDDMSLPERVEWLKANKNKVFETTREAGGLELNTTDAVLKDILPKNPILDDTGNVELVLPPNNSLEELLHKVEYINKKIGYGSMQATTGMSRKAFFLETLDIPAEESFRRNLGYLNVIHDMDVLEKMHLGYQRWVKDETKSKLVMRSFHHPWLGPMTEMKHDVMSKLLKENTLGNRFEKKYMEKVAFSDASFKYTGSTSYRPDIATDADIIVLEARDAHSNMDVLVERLVRNTNAMTGDRKMYAAAADLKPFDSVADFNKFTKSQQKMIEDLFPAHINPAYPAEYYQGNILLAAQTYRNFGFPLRDWRTQVEFLGGGEELMDKVIKAQTRYKNEVEKVRKALANGTMDKAKAQATIQSEAAYFAQNSGLYDAYQTWQKISASFETTEYTKIIERFSK